MVTPRRTLRNHFLISFKTKAFGDQKPSEMRRDDPKLMYIVTISDFIDVLEWGR